MTSIELVSLLDTGISLLESNQAVVTPELLGGLESLVQSVQEQAGLMNAACSLLRTDKQTMAMLLPFIRKALAAEMKLVTGQGAQLIERMKKLKASPRLLWFLGKCL